MPDESVFEGKLSAAFCLCKIEDGDTLEGLGATVRVHSILEWLERWFQVRRTVPLTCHRAYMHHALCRAQKLGIC